MTNQPQNRLDNCASVADLCERKLEITSEEFAARWPTDEAWKAVSPDFTKEEVLETIRRVADRCMQTGRAYADALAASAGGSIRSMTDAQVAEATDLGLVADMPELTLGQVAEGDAQTIREVVRLAFNERLAEIKIQMLAAAAAQISRERQGDLSRLVQVGRTLAELAMLEAPEGFDILNDADMVARLKADMFSYLPELDWMDDAEAEDRMNFILAAAGERFAEIRASSGSTQPTNQKREH